jgi:hypothetical protein
MKPPTAITHIRDTDFPELGLALRPNREGLESDLVRCFVNSLPWDAPIGSHITLFEQPKLETGFPDIVLVLWDTRRTLSWPEQRLKLTRADIRILHHLVTSGDSTIARLVETFGRWVSQCIERLSAAHVVYSKGGLLRPKRLDRIFAVQQIVAFEAKMSSPSKALAQASRNRWFASQSYIIVPKKPRDSWSIRKANQFGVGIWSFHGNGWVCQAPSCVETLPRSYASWLFNEWAWSVSKLSLVGVNGVQP